MNDKTSTGNNSKETYIAYKGQGIVECDDIHCPENAQQIRIQDC